MSDNFSPISKAVMEVSRSIDEYVEGHEYSKIEITKIALANEFLKVLGLNTQPDFSSIIERRSEVKRKNRVVRLGYVYLVKNFRNGMTKIGFSTKPSLREKTLQSEEPEVSMIATWRGTFADEIALHHRFSTVRVRGEWFNLSDHQIGQISSYFSGGK